MADLADHAAADTAGWKRVQLDRGAGISPRYLSYYEKPVVGEPTASGGILRADGVSDSSQAAADTAALAALNGQRRVRYGAGSAGFGGRGGQLVVDVS